MDSKLYKQPLFLFYYTVKWASSWPQSRLMETEGRKLFRFIRFLTVYWALSLFNYVGAPEQNGNTGVFHKHSVAMYI